MCTVAAQRCAHVGPAPSLRQFEAAEQLTRSKLNLHGTRHPPVAFSWRLLHFLRSVEAVLASSDGDTQWSLLYSDELWETISERLSSGEELYLGEGWENLESVSQPGSDRAMINWPELPKLVKAATEQLRAKSASSCHDQRPESHPASSRHQIAPRKGNATSVERTSQVNHGAGFVSLEQTIADGETSAAHCTKATCLGLVGELKESMVRPAGLPTAVGDQPRKDRLDMDQRRERSKEKHLKVAEHRKPKRKTANVKTFVNYGLL